MAARFKFAKYIEVAALCVGTLLPAYAQGQTTHPRKSKKQELPPLPSGPTGQKLPQIPLDNISPVLPQVTYLNGQLTIVAANSTLGDILRAVRKQTGAEIDVPTATDRVVTHLGPGPARDVMAELLNGSRFNYVLLGSPDDPSMLTRVVLVTKSETSNVQIAQQQPQQAQPTNLAPPPQEMQQDANDAEQPEENADDNNGEQQPQPEQEQPGQQGDQAVKTPQQLLQEMQQRQMQMQQQGVPGQPPYPGRPPVPQQQQQ